MINDKFRIRGIDTNKLEVQNMNNRAIYTFKFRLTKKIVEFKNILVD